MDSPSFNAQGCLFDVLVLAASAGGHAAILTVLRGLPADFPLPILIMQHLAPGNAGTAAMYGRCLPFPVEWVHTDSILAPGKVLICPPKSFVELLPDGSFMLSPNERGTVDKPIDRLFESLARSFGERALGVILTGMLSDGALGARQLHLAGGKVVVQSEATSEYFGMPRAAIQADAADLVVPLEDIGPLLGKMVAGTPRQQTIENSSS